MKPGQKTQEQLEEEKREKEAYGDEDYGDEYGEYDDEEEEKKDDDEVNDGKKGVVGIKKTDLEFEDKYEKLSTIIFRLNDIYNLRNKDEEKRQFDLLSETFKREKIGRLNILKCVFLDRFTFLDYI